MVKAQKNTAAVVQELLADTIAGMGYQLWDVEFVKEGSEWYLRITIDKEDGIDINDCERVHRAIDPILDEADPIEQSYRLEVSSPGLERVIRTPAHIEACMGRKVCVKLYTALQGSKTWTGVLASYDSETRSITLKPERKQDSLTIALSAISRMNTVFDFEADTL